MQHRGTRLRQQQTGRKGATQNEFYLRLSLRVPASRLVSRVSSEEAMGIAPILGYSSGPSRTGYRHPAYSRIRLDSVTIRAGHLDSAVDIPSHEYVLEPSSIYH